MARTRKSAAALFDAITLEGNLITPAMLSRIAAHEFPGQSEVDYDVPKGLTLRDEIARYFRIGQALFQELFASPTPSANATVLFTERLLREVFGFHDVGRAGQRELHGRTFVVTLEALGGRVPIVVVPPSDELDRPSTNLQGEGRRRSAASAVQEWLNAYDAALWGLCCNGNTLRLLRDNASLTRPAYVEANLRQLFEAEDFADFAALWLLIHASRFGPATAPPADSALERWRDSGGKEGESARERLSIGVREALLSLGTGFLAHPENAALRERLVTGQLPLPEFFGQLLRLVYRLIFLLAAEDRGLLHALGVPANLRKLYAQGYSLGALRDSAIRRSAWDQHRDRWEGLLITFAALAEGDSRLGLPALGGIFDHGVIPELESLRLANRALMEAIYRLAWLKEPSGILPVNWRDMETEELGSVYEGLLELTPRLAPNGRALSFAKGAETKGNERKTSGSYYTPDSLVQALLDSALDPVLDRVESEAEDPAAALLGVTVIDPACGSGHFLLAAARRIATRLAHARSGGVASAEDYRHALRDVTRSCIYGVDRNPMAVELTKVALWIETVEPGKPLGFLDANIRCGDSLLGIYDLEVLREGIPDAAYKPLSGDDKVVAKDFEKRNKEQRAGQGTLFGAAAGLPAPPPLAAPTRRLRSLPEDTRAQIDEKRRQFAQAAQERERARWRQAADAYIAAFLVPKTRKEAPSLETATIPTTADVYKLITGDSVVYGPRVGRIQQLVDAALPFHWPLEFPDIMERGGFDVVLGNPPWERIKIQEQEFFASRDPEIAEAPNAAARGSMIAAIRDAPEGTRERVLFNEFETTKRIAEASSVFARLSVENHGRFPLCGRGDVNTYALFAELFAALASSRGRAGVVVPTGIATDSTTAPYFAAMIERNRLVRLVDFENREGLFPDVDSRMKFSLLTLGQHAGIIEFAFFLTNPSQLGESNRLFNLSPAQIAQINPNTKTAPIFRTKMDAELTAKTYGRVLILLNENMREGGNPWGISFMAMFHMANDSGAFRTAEQLREQGYVQQRRDWHNAEGEQFVPLYEAKMIHQFNHRWSTYTESDSRDVTPAESADPSFEVTARYWVPRQKVVEVLANAPWTRNWFIGWRDITNATNERTVIASVFPWSAVGHTCPLMFQDAPVRQSAALYSNLNALTLDYVARQKVGGTHLTYGYLKQLPVLPPAAYSEAALNFIVPRVLELTYTSHSMASFARDLGYEGEPFRWDEERRALLRAELDAWYARAYGLTRDELRYILDPADVMGPDYPSETFRVLKNNEMKKFGEYRTQRLVLAAWDRQAAPEIPQSMPVAVPSLVPTPTLPDGAWVMPSYNAYSVTAQLAAILKQLPGPTPAEKVRLAAIYALHPHRLTPRLKGNAQREWERLTVSRSAHDANVIGFRPTIQIEWRDAYTQLKGMKALLEDGPNNTWVAGPAVREYPTESWPDGRAGFVMKALEELGTETLIAELPVDLQAWVKGHAA